MKLETLKSKSSLKLWKVLPIHATLLTNFLSGHGNYIPKLLLQLTKLQLSLLSGSIATHAQMMMSVWNLITQTVTSVQHFFLRKKTPDNLLFQDILILIIILFYPYKDFSNYLLFQCFLTEKLWVKTVLLTLFPIWLFMYTTQSRINTMTLKVIKLYKFTTIQIIFCFTESIIWSTCWDFAEQGNRSANTVS